jgi:hypothetical protein
MDELSVKIKIADREYPMKVKRMEEEKVRAAGKLINEKHLPADGYSFHPWIMDDLVALLPQMGVKRDGVEKWAVLTSGPELQDWSAAHQRWTVTQSIPEWGLHFTWFADLLHDDPVMHCWGKMIWSDRTDPNYNRRFENFAVRSGTHTEPGGVDFMMIAPAPMSERSPMVMPLRSVAFTPRKQCVPIVTCPDTTTCELMKQ